MKKILQKQLVLPVFLLLGAIGNLLAQGSTNMILVAETDFSCSVLDSTTNFASIDEVDGFGNSLIEPRLSTSLPLTTTTRSTATKSDFLSKAQYAITSNPKKLDELRMLDEEGWGFVSSTTVGGKVILSLSVSGLKDNSNYRVEIEYYVPLTADEIKTSSYNVSLRAVVNPTPGNETGGASTQGSNQLPDHNTLREGYTNTLSITQASMNCRPISGGGALNLYISSEKGGLGQAIMIKSIKVYGTPDATVSGPKEVCAGGESILLSVASSFTPEVTYQWYRKEGNSGVKLTGETGMRLKHVSGKVENKTTTYYYMAIIPDGKGGTVEVKSNEFTVKDIMCCMDENGNPMSQKIIWQDDFGTFTSGTEYWTWDYTDLSNPKKVTHQTSGSDKWITDLPYDIPGAVYNNETRGDMPRPEGWYRVVSFLSDQGGADLGWTAVAYDGKYPNFSRYGKYSNGIPYFPDHTYEYTSAMGGMLMLNMGCYQGDVIYQRVIRGIKEKKLTFRCYINTFSDTYVTPVAIYVRATEVDDSGQPVGTPYVSDVVEKLASNDPVSTDWKEVKVEFELTQHSNVSVEIITNVGDGIEGINNAQGNDLLLDDIQLLACTEMKDPDPDPTIIKCTESTQPIIYANGKNVKSIHLSSGESVTLTSNNVMSENESGNPYTNYTMSWHKGNAESKPISNAVGSVAKPLEVKWEDADKKGTSFILKVQDNIVNPNGSGIFSANVINSTSFETVDSLCNPNLSDDEDGWFSENVDKILSECGTTQEYANKLLQNGMIAKVSSPSKLFDSKSWQNCVKSQNGTGAGMTAIVRNPKLIDPILWEGNGTNMLVNAGSAHCMDSSIVFLAYTLSGLRPASIVKLTADFYYLLDERSINEYYELNESISNKYTFGGGLQIDPVQGKVAGMPHAVIRWTTNLNSDGKPDFLGTNHEIKLAQKTGAQSEAMVGYADSNGNITFYFGRYAPSNTPIGIDNIEITGTVQDNIVDPTSSESGVCNSYDTIIVYADAAPETGTYCLDENGNPMSQKIIWQDDFGTFTSETEYWTWDYTDLSNPKKVTHQTSGSDKWITDLPYEIPGAVYNGMKKGEAPRPEGWYRVVSFLSDQGGADLGWTAVAYDGTYPNKSKYALKKDGVSYFPDHTYQDTSAMGGMLQINMGCYKGEVIYSRVISGLCEKTMVFKCFINTFSDSYGTPVSIYLRATEIDDSGQPVGTPFVSDPVEKLAINDRESAGWKEVRVAFELTRTGNVMLEIVSNNGDGPDGYENSQGNDLLLDDIQLFTCGTPDVNIYFDKNLSEKETVACEGESIGLYVDESEAIKSYWNGNPYYVYQYSTTPDNSKSWKTIVITEDNHCLVQHSSSDSLGQNEKVYYRCVTGTLSVLENEISLYGYFRPNDPCGAFSISTPIERTVYCVTRVETQPAENIDEIVNVYTITGALVKSNVRRSKALNGLKKGSYYIIGHEKVLVDL
ncbi:MAG: hypothetical protein J6Y22_02645 [Paludibacteraceae bacterium]|nr:hypothetical protein [Paludibacteraceae bacterium]